MDLHQNERIELGRKIREARKLRNLGLRKMAKACGVREQTLMDMELGRNSEINTMLTVTKFLGLGIDLAEVTDCENK